MKNDAVSARPYRRPQSHGHSYTMKLQPGHVLFRIVCHESIVGLFIGRKGNGVAAIYRETGAGCIHCEDPVPFADHRVISVVGSGAVDKTIVLDADESRRLECQVSFAQEALIRVFERLWTLDKGEDEGVYCGILVDASQVGAVMGKGGKNISRMRTETGAKITVLPPPSCAAPNDRLIQIIGKTLAAKKGLAAISCCLQECPPVDNEPIPYVRPVETSDPHAEFFPHLSALLPPLPGNSNGYSARFSSSQTNGVSSQDQCTEVSFRLLCSHAAVGGIIGKKGSVIRALQNETSASITFPAPVADYGDRVVTVSAMENLESRFSPAQNAVVLVFARSVESDIQRGLSPGLSNDITVTARLLVVSNVVGCLNGRIISEVIDSTASDIQILEYMDNDVVVQITGIYQNVQNALFQVTARLRNSLLTADLLNEGRESEGVNGRLAVLLDSISGPALTGEMDQLTESETSSTTFGGNVENEEPLDNLLPRDVLNEVGLNNSSELLPNSDQETIRAEAMSQVELSENMGTRLSSRTPKIRGCTTDRKNGATSHSGDLELESEMGSAPVGRNTYVEIPVSKHALVSVFGKDRSSVARLCQMSGAKVEVCEPGPGKSEGMIIMSGMSDEVRACQSLLLASLLSDQSHQC